MAKKLAKVTPSVEVHDFTPYQEELQRLFYSARDAVDAAMVGVNIDGTMVKRPTGKIVATFDHLGGSRAKKATVYGHFATNQWQVDGQKLDHIAINPYMMGEATGGAEQVLHTMVHEYVHLVAKASGIEDTSNNGYFHNKRFAALANATKVICAVKVDKIGHTTQLTEAGESWIREEVQPNFGDLVKLLEAPPKKKEPSTMQFECLECGNKATVSVKQHTNGFTPYCGHDHDLVRMFAFKN